MSETASSVTHPCPPNFPKQEGEPPLVRPSRINKTNWTADGKPVESHRVAPEQAD
jgi:hypothetical protein